MFLTLSLISTHTAHAQWNPDALAFSQSFYSDFPGAYTASAWNSIKMNFTIPQYPQGSLKIDLKSKHFKSGKLPGLIYLQKDKEGNLSKAPLMLHIPGIFSDIRDLQSFRVLDDFASRGFHTIVIPNPWSAQYIEEGAQDMPGYMESESTAILDIISQVKESLLQGDLVSDVHLSGNSYGGFLVAVIAALDAESPHPIVTGQTTITAPPYQVKHALNALDKLMIDFKDIYDNLSDLDKLVILQSYRSAKKETDLFLVARKLAPAFIAFPGFNEFLGRTMVAVNKMKQVGVVPEFKTESDFLKWSHSYNFDRYTAEFNPEILPLMLSEIGRIDYWIQRSLAAGNKRIRMISAANDFINVGDLHRMEKIPAENYILIPKGGHSGFTGFPWYKQFMNYIYGEPKELPRIPAPHLPPSPTPGH